MKKNYLSQKTKFLLELFLKQKYILLLATLILFPGNFTIAQTAGPNNAGTGANNAATGTIGWTNSGNITAADGVNATVAVTSGAFTNYIHGSNYGFSIPAGVVINGIEVIINRRTSANNGGRVTSDSVVKLVKNGSVLGNNNAAIGVGYPTALTTATYGSPTDKWGLTWLASDINASNFGAVLSVTANNSLTASVDYIQIKVYYTPAPTISSFTATNACIGSTPSIVITGNHFNTATNVSFNGVSASFTVNSNTQITATLPVSATTGTITVNSPSGTGTSASNFTVNPLPVLNPITGTTSVCIGSTTTLSNSTSGGSWNSASTGVATINSSGVVSTVSAGTSIITYSYTNGNGCTSSVNTTVTVNALPVVSSPTSVCIGNSIQLSPNSGGTWTSSDNTKATIDNTGLVNCLAPGSTTFTFTNSTTNCSKTTNTVNVLALPAISSQPIATQTICSGSSVSFSVSATGVGLTYQWYNGATALNNVGSIAGATSATLTINPVALGDASVNYNCIVSGTCSPAATSANAELIVIEKVIITSQPVATQTLCTGDTATFVVAATGTSLSYQWYKGVTALVDGGSISGATSATLTINPVVTSDAATNYKCVVSGTSPCVAATSNNAALVVNQLPAITSQPAASQTICSGSSVSFSVTATGSNLTYQWFNGATTMTNGGSVSGATSATLTINPASTSDASANYKCVVSGSCVPNVTSNDAALIVNQIVSITSQPVLTQTICAGSPATFSVAATGTGLSYQWYKGVTALVDGGSISGATSATLTINPVVTGDAATNYKCVVSGTSPCAAVTSNNAALVVNQLPAITSQPAASQTICSGSSVSFSVTATGTNLTYQWFNGATPIANGGSVSGATSATLTINPASTSDASTNYKCVVSGSCAPSVTSNDAALIVNQIVSITSQPVITQTICAGSSATFSVAATGTGLSYQWYKGAIALTNVGSISGATSAALTINPVVTGDAATNYKCVVSGTSPCAAATSNNAALVVSQLPAITAQPAASQTICSGSSVSFSVTATGSNLTYQWFNGATTMTNGGSVSGATSASLTINPISASNASSNYKCVVSGSCAPSVTSNDAQLIVSPKAVIPTQTVTTCSQSGFSLTPIDGVPNASTVVPSNTLYSWSAPSVTGGMTGGALQNGQTSIVGTLTNNTNVNQTATYTVTPASGISPICSGSSFTVIVTVEPKPFVQNVTATVCTENSLTFTPTNGSGNIIPTGTLYSWGIPVVTGGITGGTAGSNQASVVQTLTNPTTSAQTATYTITPTSGNCNGSTFTLTVTVNPKPTTTVNIATQTACSGIAFSAIVVGNTNNLATTYTWTRDNTTNVSGTTSGTSGVIAAGSTFSLSQILTNNTAIAQSVIYTFTPTSNGCVGNQITSTVIVNNSSVGGTVSSSLPGVTPVVRTITECHFATGTVYLTGHVGNVVRWEYSSNGGSIWVPIANTTASNTYTNITQSTIFRAVIQNGAACNLAYSLVTMVNVIPNIKPTPVTATPQTICAGDSSNLYSESGFATNAFIATGGTFSNSNPVNWLVDGCGNCLNASNNSTGPFRLSASNGGTYAGINYTASGKFAIASGNFNSIMQTPIFSTLGLSSGTLSFNHAFNLQTGASISVELSLDGGVTYTVVLAQYLGASTRSPYNAFPLETIDLSNYIGQTNLRIRFVYNGNANSSWAIDNIDIPDAPLNLTSEWVDSSTGLVISTTATAVVSPTITTTYAITSHLNGCTSTGPNGTTYITVTVNQRPTASIGPSQTICNGGTATFSVALTGVAPWSVTYSNGTTSTTVNNINTNPYVFSISGITVNQTYTITALSDSKCTAKPQDLTGSAVVTTLNGVAGLWTGLVSNDWFDCKNWAGGLPSATINAQIPNGLSRYPIVDPSTSSYASLYSGIANAQDVIIANAASVTMATSSNLYVSRDWKNSGTFTPGQGTVTFNSATLNQIQGINSGIKTNETFYNLTLNNSNSAIGISIVDGFELTVANNLSLLN
ncbi:PKD-like domain-containing protein [Flavobacterium sp.]|uniref:beta strand repeat-containing protein n=1 Tax=Flavobacterium sp. TaxID=239 RepID=UPI0025D9C678|nr:PKD-like domain-containing protein [Flavobacterium sp.]